MKQKKVICDKEGPCFARDFGACRILTAVPEGKCSFQKEASTVTNGKSYPYDPDYGKGKSNDPQ